MAMSRAQLFLAFGMLFFGSLNTVSINFANMSTARGTTSPSTIWGKVNGEFERDHLFTHPFFQATVMFLGEFLCMIGHLASRKLAPQEVAIGRIDRGCKEAFLFSIPAICDAIGTGTMYAGLCLSYASVFQMLRGSSVVFTALISTFFLGRKIHVFQWFAVFLVVFGVFVVGVVSLGKEDPDSKDPKTVFLGDMLIVAAQVIVAVQMCVEEKLIVVYRTPALKAVGLEGSFGVVLLGLALIPMYYVHIDGYPIENVPDALVQMQENWVIVVGMLGNMTSIAFYNFFGVSVTKSMSAAHRMVVDSARTMVVWACSLALGWEKFHWLQLVGFVILSIGTAIYNEIIVLPRIFTYPAKRPLSDDAMNVSMDNFEPEA